VARPVVVRRVEDLEDDSAAPDASEPDGPTRTED
jgi:hypothetical protein